MISYVPVATTTEAATEQLCGDIVPLREAKGQRRSVKVIQPGWGSSGYWPAEVLERDGPAAWPAGTQMFLDHPTESEESDRPERSVRDLAATLATDAAWQADGSDGPGLYAETVVAEPYTDLIDAIAEDIGVSVNTWAEAPIGEKEGRRGPVISRIASADESPFNSVDFVTKAGAGGKVLALMESVRAKAGTPPTTDATQHEKAPTSSESARTPREGHEMDETKLKEQLEAATAERDELRTKNEKLSGENASLRERVALSEAGTAVAVKLGESDLPEITRTRLTASLVKTVALAEDGTLDVTALEAKVTEAIADESAYIAKLTESGKVRDQGASTAPDGALHESFKSRYLADGKSEEQAEQMAAVAAAGR